MQSKNHWHGSGIGHKKLYLLNTGWAHTMKIKQSILSIMYPFVIWLSRLMGGRIKVLSNKQNMAPPNSLYQLSFELNNGKTQKLESFKGKKMLLVNTASDCGYTRQYEDLQALYEKEEGKLVVIGFPANDFKEQEAGNDEQIAAFCKLNFGVNFPLAKKSSVVKGEGQNPVFQWLSDSSKNGWCNRQPSWNFSKYLIDEKGSLTHYFDPAISPVSQEVLNAIKKV